MPFFEFDIFSIFSTLIISLAIQLFFFGIATSFKTDKVTDLSYGLTFIIISLLLCWSNPNLKILQSLLIVAVIIWGIRLISYLFMRILKIKKDRRFDGTRENFSKFAKFWFFQGIAVWIIMFPTTLVVSTSINPKFSLFYYIGFFVWLSGLILETIADLQKYKFKNNPDNKGKWVSSGLWKYSRHPNYFGEILCWWGLFIVVIPHLQTWNWFVITGPLFITYILLFVSGIPPLEKRYNEKYKDNKEYLKYKENTPLLIPNIQRQVSR